MVDLSELREALDEREDEARFQRMWGEVQASRAGARTKTESPRTASPRRWRAARFAAVPALAAAAALLLWVSTRDEGPLQAEDGRDLPAQLASEGRVSLSDGSRITLAEHTSLDVLENHATGVSFALRGGRARFDVEPGGPRRWRIDCGHTRVEVVGTAFTLDRTDDTLDVQVHRGTVVVSGPRVPDGSQRLEAGGHLVVPPPAPEPTSEPLADRDVTSAEPPPALAPEVEPARAPPRRPASPAWHRAAATGDHRAAFEELGAQGIRRETERARGAEELMLVADVARLSGHPRAAIEPLERIVDQHATDPRAPMAAYALAQIQLEVTAEPAAAAHAFERAIALGVSGPLRETAHARRVEALGRAGSPRAAEAAREYLEAYPEGSYRTRVERWLD